MGRKQSASYKEIAVLKMALYIIRTALSIILGEGGGKTWQKSTGQTRKQRKQMFPRGR